MNPLRITILFIALAGITVFSSCHKEDKDENEANTVVTFGALLPLTGPDAAEGSMARSAIGCALYDVNTYMQQIGSPLRFECVIRDMQSNAAACLQQTMELNSQGIHILLGGPYNSDELAAIKTYLDTHNIIILNAYSTSPSLSVAGDAIFRLLPDDQQQAAGTVAMLKHDSVSMILPVYVNDLYGSGLWQQIKTGFEAAGGFTSPGISFAPGTTDFTSSISTLNTLVSQAVSQYGAGKTRVVLITGEETVPIFTLADTYPQLKSVRWIGTDGSACQNDIVANTSAAQFAVAVHFLASVYEVGMNLQGNYTSQVQDIITYISQETGLNPNSNTFNVYDAVKILALAYQSVRNEDASAYKVAIPQICRNYFTGPLTSRELNNAGDIAKPVYGFWGVVQNGSFYEWKLGAHYFSDGDQLSYLNP